jgi:hypothetical protein
VASSLSFEAVWIAHAPFVMDIFPSSVPKAPNRGTSVPPARIKVPAPVLLSELFVATLPLMGPAKAKVKLVGTSRVAV